MRTTQKSGLRQIDVGFADTWDLAYRRTPEAARFLPAPEPAGVARSGPLGA
jgi:hypothetical protein